MLDARDIVVCRGGRDLLQGVTLTVAAGRVTVLVGANGAGKSTLLRVLAGEIRPDRGTVTLQGLKLSGLSAKALAARRAVVPQAAELAFPFTALEIVRLGASVPGFTLTAADGHCAARASLAAVAMSELVDRPYTSLSGGERQRVMVAKALCQLSAARRYLAAGEAQALLLDEPTASLDLAHQDAVLGEARRAARAGCAVLVVLHDLNLAAAFGDEIAILREGRVLATGTPSRVLRKAVLTEAYDTPIAIGEVPPPGVPFVLPRALISAA